MLDFAEIIMCLKKGNTNIIIPIIVLIQKNLYMKSFCKNRFIFFFFFWGGVSL